jgi:membrane protein
LHDGGFHEAASPTARYGSGGGGSGTVIISTETGSPAWLRRGARATRVLLVGVVREFFDDQIPRVAAGVTFYVLLAFFPAVAAFVSLYGLFADIHTALVHLAYLRDVLPGESLRFVGDEMIRLTTAHPSQLSAAFVLSLVFSVWSANAGVLALIEGLNVAYDRKESRGLVRLYLFSLAMTAGGLIVCIAAFVIVVAIPVAEADLGLPALSLSAAARWPVLEGVTVAALAFIYRYGPDRPLYEVRASVLPGSIVASLVWLAGSILFSRYVADFAQYDKTYGSLGAIIAFMVWIWLGLMVILLGAELNASLEQRRRLSAPPDSPIRSGAPK